MSGIPVDGARVTVIVESDDGHYTEARRVGQLNIGYLLAQCISALGEARNDDQLDAIGEAAHEAARRFP